MKFVDILLRIRNLLFHPVKEWETIAAENRNRKTVFIRFVVPLLCLVTVASIVGSLLFASRLVYSLGYVVCKVAILWCSLGLGLYLSSYLITEITARYVGSKNHDKTFELLAYASGTALLVITIVELFPFFGELLVLAFYSCYLYWRGIPYLIRIEGQKQMVFGILSFVIAALTFSLVFYFFGNILRAILMSN